MTSGRPSPSQTACSLEFKPPLVRPIRRGTGPFLKGSRRCDAPSSVASIMIRSGLPPLRANAAKILLNTPKRLPANEPIVDRLVRAVLSRRVAPAKPVLDHKHDRAHDPPVVNPRHPVRTWK